MLWGDAQSLPPDRIFIAGPKQARVGVVLPEAQLHHLPPSLGSSSFPSPLPTPTHTPTPVAASGGSFPQELLSLPGDPWSTRQWECVGGDQGPFKLEHPLDISQKFMSHFCLIKSSGVSWECRRYLRTLIIFFSFF